MTGNARRDSWHSTAAGARGSYRRSPNGTTDHTRTLQIAGRIPELTRHEVENGAVAVFEEE